MSRLILFGVAALFAVLHGPAGASAESYPQRAVRFILPFGPGAGVDITARMLTERLAARWGKPVVVENRPGGDGIVAINVFTSAKDDHTLLFVPTSTFTAHPYTHDKLPYDPQRDLLPIATVTVIVIALASPESLRIASLGDFVAMARALPGTLNAAAAPGNSDLVLAGFLKDMNLQVAKVPYRDIMQAPNDLAESRIQLLMSSYASMRGLIEAGKLKVLAVTSRKRVGIAPAIPTVAEAGFPFLGLDGLIGVFGSRGMSDALRESIAASRPWSRPTPRSQRDWEQPDRLSMCVAPPNSPQTSKSSTTRSRTSPRRLESRPRSECQVRTSNMSRLIELEPLDLRIEVRGRNHVREIDRHPDIARAVRARDQAAVLADERPQRQNQVSQRLTVEDEGLQTHLRLPVLEHVVDHRVDVAAVDIDMSGGRETGLQQRVDGAAVAVHDMGEILLVRRIAPAFLDGVEHHHLHQQRGDAELARSRVTPPAAARLGLGRRFVSARCRLNHAGAENVFRGPVHDVKQPMLPGGIAEHMRRTIE